jgi:hypothetical protein
MAGRPSAPESWRGASLAGLTGLLCLLASALQAQVTDTLAPDSWGGCLEEPVLWLTPGIGPVFGNNALGDLGKAQLLRLPGPGDGFVTHALLHWGYQRVGADGRLRVRAWSVGPDGAPESPLSSTERIRVSEVDTASLFQVLAFSSPAPFIGAVFLSLELDELNTGDTLSLFASQDSCGSGCTSWERWSDGTWNPVCDTYNFEDVDMLIRAVVDWNPWSTSVPLPELASERALGAARLFPQPASGPVWLEVPAPPGSQLNWALRHVSGALAMQGSESMPTPVGRLLLNVQTLEPGSYLLVLELRTAEGLSRRVLPCLLTNPAGP